jgi:hypothetical protein
MCRGIPIARHSGHEPPTAPRGSVEYDPIRTFSARVNLIDVFRDMIGRGNRLRGVRIRPSQAVGTYFVIQARKTVQNPRSWL